MTSQVHPLDEQAWRRTPKPWPFWKMIPRFDREYHLRDLVKAVRTLAGDRAPRDIVLDDFASPGGQTYLARSGRQCLYLILKMLGLPASSRIGVPLYCCASVFEAIVRAGHLPVFLDADLNTYALAEEHLYQRSRELDALVVVHTFGYPADLIGLRAALGGRDIPIIEDCAHALFSEYRGRRVGTFGQASFYTFGMHKPAAVGGGAAIVINDPDLAKIAARECSKLRAPQGSDELHHSLVCWGRSLFYQRAVYGALLQSPLGRFRDEEAVRPQGNGDSHSSESFLPLSMRLVDRTLLEERIDGFRERVGALARNTEKLREAVRASSLYVVAEPAFGKWNHFMVPVRYRTAGQCGLARKFLMARGIDTAPLYRNCGRNAREFGYSGDCPQAELAAETVCTVPNHPWLSDSEIAYVGESLRLSAELN